MIVAIVCDDKNRKNTSQVYFWLLNLKCYLLYTYT